MQLITFIFALVVSSAVYAAPSTCIPRQNKTPTAFKNIDPRVNGLIAQILESVQAEDKKKLRAFFHPRLQRNTIDLTDFFARLRLTYRAPYTLNVTRLWELQTIDSVAESFCSLDTLYLRPLYGYPLQYYLWLSVVGKKELGRIIIVLVEPGARKRQKEGSEARKRQKEGSEARKRQKEGSEARKRQKGGSEARKRQKEGSEARKRQKGDSKIQGWVIGALHSQQWTHHGLDFNDWLGKAEAARKNPMLSYLMYDIALKLLKDSPFMRFPQKETIRERQQKTITTDRWKKKIKNTVPKQSIIFVNSILTQNGIGILLRIQITQAISGKGLNNLCRTTLTAFKAQKWFAGFSGIKCSFVIKGEDPSREGVLGGIYLPL